jgi:hypothetical protein
VLTPYAEVGSLVFEESDQKLYVMTSSGWVMIPESAAHQAVPSAFRITPALKSDRPPGTAAANKAGASR